MPAMCRVPLCKNHVPTRVLRNKLAAEGVNVILTRAMLTDEAKRQIWANAISRKYGMPEGKLILKKRNVICDKHFVESDFEDISKSGLARIHRRLKSIAVPYEPRTAEQLEEYRRNVKMRRKRFLLENRFPDIYFERDITKSECGIRCKEWIRIQAETWDDIARILNGMNGVRKDAAMWKRSWQDIKKNCKKKVNALRSSQNRTGGGQVDVNLRLTALDDAVIKICGPAITGIEVEIEGGFARPQQDPPLFITPITGPSPSGRTSCLAASPPNFLNSPPLRPNSSAYAAYPAASLPHFITPITGPSPSGRASCLAASPLHFQNSPPLRPNSSGYAPYPAASPQNFITPTTGPSPSGRASCLAASPPNFLNSPPLRPNSSAYAAYPAASLPHFITPITGPSPSGRASCLAASPLHFQNSPPLRPNSSGYAPYPAASPQNFITPTTGPSPSGRASCLAASPPNFLNSPPLRPNSSGSRVRSRQGPYRLQSPLEQLEELAQNPRNARRRPIIGAQGVQQALNLMEEHIRSQNRANQIFEQILNVQFQFLQHIQLQPPQYPLQQYPLQQYPLQQYPLQQQPPPQQPPPQHPPPQHPLLQQLPPQHPPPQQPPPQHPLLQQLPPQQQPPQN
ncbi:hypothetical protein DMENIID0001_140410 [Sergentomyia squamirostris]